MFPFNNNNHDNNRTLGSSWAGPISQPTVLHHNMPYNPPPPPHLSNFFRPPPQMQPTSTFPYPHNSMIAHPTPYPHNTYQTIAHHQPLLGQIAYLTPTQQQQQPIQYSTAATQHLPNLPSQQQPQFYQPFNIVPQQGQGFRTSLIQDPQQQQQQQQSQQLSSSSAFVVANPITYPAWAEQFCGNGTSSTEYLKLPWAPETHMPGVSLMVSDVEYVPSIPINGGQGGFRPCTNLLAMNEESTKLHIVAWGMRASTLAQCIPGAIYRFSDMLVRVKTTKYSDLNVPYTLCFTFGSKINLIKPPPSNMQQQNTMYPPANTLIESSSTSTTNSLQHPIAYPMYNQLSNPFYNYPQQQQQAPTQEMIGSATTIQVGAGLLPPPPQYQQQEQQQQPSTQHSNQYLSIDGAGGGGGIAHPPTQQAFQFADPISMQQQQQQHTEREIQEFDQVLATHRQQQQQANPYPNQLISSSTATSTSTDLSNANTLLSLNQQPIHLPRQGIEQSSSATTTNFVNAPTIANRTENIERPPIPTVRLQIGSGGDIVNLTRRGANSNSNNRLSSSQQASEQQERAGREPATAVERRSRSPLDADAPTSSRGRSSRTRGTSNPRNQRRRQQREQSPPRFAVEFSPSPPPPAAPRRNPRRCRREQSPPPFRLEYEPPATPNFLPGEGMSTQEVEHSLPSLEISLALSRERCAICREQFTLGKLDGTVLNCDHYYHLKCAKKWLLTMNRCPLCNAKMI